ncbi:MAG: transglycosylase domain-containing protein [Rikenellaceae bacterium]
MTQPKNSKSKKKGIARLWEKLGNPRRKKLFAAIFWTIIIAPFASLAILIILIIAGAFGELPSFEELENPRSNIATELISSDGKQLGSFFVENRSYTDYSELSPNLVAALIATEDARFSSHSGIDFIGLGRVAFKTLLLFQSDQGGGSTISQQLAKNLYPRDTTTRSAIGKTFNLVVSKLKEWVTATMLEYNYTKEEIVAMYLNVVGYGSNAYGIKSASATFFGKAPLDLTVPEAAMLIGVVNAPTRYSPVVNPENALKRRNTVISRMATMGYIPADKAEEYKAEDIVLNYNPVSHNAGSATYFREMVRLYMTAKEPKRSDYNNDWDFDVAQNLWNNDPLYGWCNKNTKADGTPYNLYRDGLKIYSTVDSRMQRYAENAVDEQMGGKDGVQAMLDKQKKNYGGKIFFNITKAQEEAIVNSAIKYSDRAYHLRQAGMSEENILRVFNEPVKMKVFGYQGDIDTTMTPRDSVLYTKSIMRCGFMAMDPSSGYVKAYVGGPSFKYFKYDMVKQGRRQVGSTVKPFIYTFAFDFLGYNPCTLVPNLPVSIETASGDAFNPKESGNVVYDGVLHPLRWGLANSRNNYSAWIMKQSSPDAVTDLIHKMGVTSWIDPVYSICTGSPEVALFEMVGAFSTFVNRGVHTTPMFVTRIEDRQGNVLSSFSPQTNEAISEKTAYTMLSMLQSNVSAGTGGRLRYQFGFMGEIGGKTGTTNNNSDAWFIGVTPQLVAGAWVGGEDRSMHLVSRGEGSVAALPIFGKFMTSVYGDKSLGISKDDMFAPPVGMVEIECDPEDGGHREEKITVDSLATGESFEEIDDFFQ